MAISLLPSKMSPLTRLAGQGRADDRGEALAAVGHRALARRPHRGERDHVDGRAGELGACDGALDDPGEDRLEPVVIAVVEVIGLGGGEEDAVDAAR